MTLNENTWTKDVVTEASLDIIDMAPLLLLHKMYHMVTNEHAHKLTIQLTKSSVLRAILLFQTYLNKFGVAWNVLWIIHRDYVLICAD